MGNFCPSFLCSPPQPPSSTSSISKSVPFFRTEQLVILFSCLASQAASGDGVGRASPLVSEPWLVFFYWAGGETMVA